MNRRARWLGRAVRVRRALVGLTWLPLAWPLASFGHSLVHLVASLFGNAEVGQATFFHPWAPHWVLSFSFTRLPSHARWVLVSPMLAMVAAMAVTATWLSWAKRRPRRHSFARAVLMVGWFGPLYEIESQLVLLFRQDHRGDLVDVVERWPVAVLAAALLGAHATWARAVTTPRWVARDVSVLGPLSLVLACASFAPGFVALALVSVLAGPWVMAAPRPSFDLGRVAGFVRSQLKWVPLGPLVTFVGTVMHELAHAAVGLALGARIETIRLWPSYSEAGFRFGFVQFDGSVDFNPFFMSLAPTLWSLALLGASGPVMHRVARPARPVVLLTLFLAPLLDVAMAWSGLWFKRDTSDLYKALADHRALGLLVVGTAVGLHVLRIRPLFNASLRVRHGLRSWEATALTLALLAVASLRWGLPPLAGQTRELETQNLQRELWPMAPTGSR